MPDKSNYNKQIQDDTLKMSGDGGKSSESSSTKGAYSGSSSSSSNPNTSSLQGDISNFVPQVVLDAATAMSGGSLNATDTKQNKNISNTVANVDNSTMKTSVGDNYSDASKKASESKTFRAVLSEDGKSYTPLDSKYNSRAGRGDKTPVFSDIGTNTPYKKGDLSKSAEKSNISSPTSTTHESSHSEVKPDPTAGMSKRQVNKAWRQQNNMGVDGKPLAETGVTTSVRNQAIDKIKQNKKSQNAASSVEKQRKKDAFSVKKKQYKKELKSEIKKYKSISSLKPYARSIAKSKVSKPKRT